MRRILLSGLILILTGCSSINTVDARVTSNDQYKAINSSLFDNKWIHGGSDCKTNTDPAIEVFRYGQASYILRQNKCLNFEAPFIYVLFGDDKVVVLDTGATENAQEFPLYKTIKSLIEEQSTIDGKSNRELLVIHSHSHSDHYSGDAQFEDHPNTTLVEPHSDAVTKFFIFNENSEFTLELGGRELTIIATPGHQEEAISVYDSQTKWLLTGDTFYPGYVYVKNWHAYKNSIAKLASFSKANEVSAVLGAHIEMTNTAGEYYPIGTTYQPNEASLVLMAEDLAALNIQLQQSKEENKIIFTKFIVAPMNAFQKTLSNIARWFTQ
ncbi:MBL fold metallo-hydrolase [Thalassotalea psychrophila]|uniref:MBL fold metallo-hydrolase n=1 Tax=Thalassotalea psychrophila TaxID=3065647 RepID=A0ABY9TU09_9GAMM|nr:MBL fold metallo-hydrolase [Colwelliaceae bacterium SQ149]